MLAGISRGHTSGSSFYPHVFTFQVLATIHVNLVQMTALVASAFSTCLNQPLSVQQHVQPIAHSRCGVTNLPGPRRLALLMHSLAHGP